MSFHLGKPILVMLGVALVAGTFVLLRPPRSGRPDLVVWVFADAHARTYGGTYQPTTRPTLLEQFERHSGLSARVELLSYRAENVRIASMFMVDLKGSELPDVVEIEIGQVGRLFRPPLRDVGLLPLNDFLRRSGWDKKVIASRFAPYSYEGVIFGVPHDVHPVTITYREDLFREAGVDLAAAKTWPAFQESCLKFQDYWRKRGRPRHAIEMPFSNADYLLVMLLQRHINPIDDHNRIHLADAKVANTVAFYATLVAGKRKIASQASGGEGTLSKDINGGDLCAFITPDWRVRHIKDYSEVDPVTGRKTMEGRMRMMPLPIFEEGDAPTSTWGGTMMGIPRNCPRPKDAWKLIEFFYFGQEGLRARLRETNILPPVIAQWNEPEYRRPDPFYGGQHVDKLFVELAPKIPARYVAPASSFASAVLSRVLDRARNYVDDYGTDGLEEQCGAWLKEAADDLQKRIDHFKFD